MRAKMTAFPVSIELTNGGDTFRLAINSKAATLYVLTPAGRWRRMWRGNPRDLIALDALANIGRKIVEGDKPAAAV